MFMLKEYGVSKCNSRIWEWRGWKAALPSILTSAPLNTWPGRSGQSFHFGSCSLNHFDIKKRYGDGHLSNTPQTEVQPIFGSLSDPLSPASTKRGFLTAADRIWWSYCCRTWAANETFAPKLKPKNVAIRGTRPSMSLDLDVLFVPEWPAEPQRSNSGRCW